MGKARTLGLSPSNTGTQNSDAWDALMASTPQGTAVEVFFEHGTYHFARQMDVIRPVRLIGRPGGPCSPTTVFRFPGTCHGVYLHSYYTLNNVSSSNRADGSVLKSLRITSGDKLGCFHGVVVKTEVTIEECLIEAWAGDGINMVAGMPVSSTSLCCIRHNWVISCGVSRAVSSAVMDGNDLVVTTTAPHQLATNDTVFLHRGQIEKRTAVACRRGVTVETPSRIRITGWVLNEYGGAWAHFIPTSVKTGNGVYVAGGDSCIIRFENNSYINCQAWAAFDVGFLGNSHIGEHADTMGIGAYCSTLSTAPTTWIGCYSEASCPYSCIGRPSVVVGGDHGAPVYGGAAGNIWGWDKDIRINLTDYEYNYAGHIEVGCEGESYPYYLYMKSPDHQFGYYTFYDYTSAQLGGWDKTFSWFNYAAGGNCAFLITTPESVYPNGRTEVDPGKFAVQKHFYMNAGSRWDEGSAPPVSGARQRGDRRWNSAPAVGQPEYWVCTVSGTPGTWVAGPNL